MVCLDKRSVDVAGYQAKPAIFDPAIVKLRRINFSWIMFRLWCIWVLFTLMALIDSQFSLAVPAHIEFSTCDVFL